ncbi:MAG: hypothetical protein KDD04_06645, partial [Sinomicrobium sp.]|nr:hypothetical protein [Sinomicrobium sp.]
LKKIGFIFGKIACFFNIVIAGEFLYSIVIFPVCKQVKMRFFPFDPFQKAVIQYTFDGSIVGNSDF